MGTTCRPLKKGKSGWWTRTRLFRVCGSRKIIDSRAVRWTALHVRSDHSASRQVGSQRRPDAGCHDSVRSGFLPSVCNTDDVCEVLEHAAEPESCFVEVKVAATHLPLFLDMFSVQQLLLAKWNRGGGKKKHKIKDKKHKTKTKPLTRKTKAREGFTSVDQHVILTGH